VPLVSSMAFLILFEKPRRCPLGVRSCRACRPLFGSADWRDRRSGHQHSASCWDWPSSIVLIWGLSLLLSPDAPSAGDCGPSPRIPTPPAAARPSISNRIVPLVFVISGLFAALAGVLFALNYRQVHPFMGEALGLKGISAMVIGGMGKHLGRDRRRADHRA